MKAGPLGIHVCSGIEEFRDEDEDVFGIVLKANINGRGALELGWAWVEEKEMKGVSFMDMQS